MTAKTLLILCASALLVQNISSQCLGAAPGIIGYGNGLGYGLGNGLGADLTAAGLTGGCGYGFGLLQAAAASGGGFAVSSYSPIAPNGVSVISENAIEGIVDVAGQLPVLATVGLEGQLPTAGAASTSYSCGNGNVGIASESLAASGYGANGLAGAGLYSGFGLANAGLGNAGLLGYNNIGGCGCVV